MKVEGSGIGGGQEPGFLSPQHLVHWYRVPLVSRICPHPHFHGPTWSCHHGLPASALASHPVPPLLRTLPGLPTHPEKNPKALLTGPRGPMCSPLSPLLSSVSMNDCVHDTVSQLRESGNWACVPGPHPHSYWCTLTSAHLHACTHSYMHKHTRPPAWPRAAAPWPAPASPRTRPSPPGAAGNSPARRSGGRGWPASLGTAASTGGL